MQLGRILLGCLAGWITGTACMTVAALALGAGAGGFMGLVVGFLTWLYFGLLAALPLALIVVLSWWVLARRGTYLSWWQIPLASTVGSLVLFWGSFETVAALSWLVFSAALVGVVFWVAAFGVRGRVQLALSVREE